MTNYAERSFKENIIYPDHHNDDDLGFRPSYFYLHGKLEGAAGFDCFNCSGDLMQIFLRRGISLASMTVDGITYKCLAFCDFEASRGMMTGYVVEIDSIEDIEDAIEKYNKAFRPCGGDTPDEYLRESHPDTWKLIMNNYDK